MLWTIAVILLVLWARGLIRSSRLGRALDLLLSSPAPHPAPKRYLDVGKVNPAPTTLRRIGVGNRLGSI